jgi:hypothetical protein
MSITTADKELSEWQLCITAFIDLVRGKAALLTSQLIEKGEEIRSASMPSLKGEYIYVQVLNYGEDKK